MESKAYRDATLEASVTSEGDSIERAVMLGYLAGIRDAVSDSAAVRTAENLNSPGKNLYYAISGKLNARARRAAAHAEDLGL